MLTRRLAAAGATLAAVTAAWTIATPAAAGEEVYCPPLGGPCIVIVTNPGQPGNPGGSGGGGGGGSSFCPLPDGVCHDPLLGWYNPADFCWYKVADPQPDPGDPAWAGHQPGDGKVYIRACSSGNGPIGVPTYTFSPLWLADPPPGFGGLPSAAQLAAQAINQLPIRGPAIGIAPDETGAGLVGLPVWMWTTVSPETWGPVSATASVPGLSVTATARATQIAWSMGDGHTEICRNPGTPYEAGFGNTDSPTCGHRYTRPGNRYTVTATTTWQVTWAGGGESGSLTVTRASTTSIRIDELQVVTS